jgi:hypothetical protein
MEIPMKPIFAFALGAFAVAPAAGFAQTQRYAAPPPYQSTHAPCQPGYSLQSQDRAAYDCSGTRGRMGLGASPFHPEGPGNPTFSR